MRMPCIKGRSFVPKPTVGTVVAGRLGKINVQVGDHVKADTALATLESSEAAQMRSDIARAKAELQIWPLSILPKGTHLD